MELHLEKLYVKLWIGKEVIPIKILLKKKKVWCSTENNVVFKSMLQETEKKDYINFKMSLFEDVMLVLSVFSDGGE